MTQSSCPCGDDLCVGHCPKCQSNNIGGGGANGMFCVACGHCWDGRDTSFSTLDHFLREVDAD